MSAVHEKLYRDVWADNPHFGTAQEWVEDTVIHRILPFVRRHRSSPCSWVDFGAGDGRYLHAIEAAGALTRGIGIDYHLPPIRSPNITHLRGSIANLAVCATPCDVAISADTLEHLPIREVDDALLNMIRVSPLGWARISLIEDPYGPKHGFVHLHEAVLPADEWMARLAALGAKVTEARVYYDHVPAKRERALEVGWAVG